MNKLWPLSENKVFFQRIFIKWVKDCFKQLMFFDLNEFWFISGRSDSATTVPIHGLVEQMNTDVVNVLPSVQPCIGCDTSKVVANATAA